VRITLGNYHVELQSREARLWLVIYIDGILFLCVCAVFVRLRTDEIHSANKRTVLLVFPLILQTIITIQLITRNTFCSFGTYTTIRPCNIDLSRFELIIIITKLESP